MIKIQSNDSAIATLGTEESGFFREVAVVSDGTNKSDLCREGSLSEGLFQCTAIIIKGWMCSFVNIFSRTERKKRVVAE